MTKATENALANRQFGWPKLSGVNAYPHFNTQHKPTGSAYNECQVAFGKSLEFLVSVFSLFPTSFSLQFARGVEQEFKII